MTDFIIRSGEFLTWPIMLLRWACYCLLFMESLAGEK
ncbi:hypothetical protein [Cytobacillus oceanisediminis]